MAMQQIQNTRQRGNAAISVILAIALIISAITVINHLQKTPNQDNLKSGSKLTGPQAGTGKCGYGHDILNTKPTQWQVGQGQDIIGEFQYLVWNRYGGKTALNVMIVGVVNQKGKLVGHTEQIFGPSIPGECRSGAKKGSATFALLAPNRPGTYSVITISGPAYNHGDLRDKYETGRETVPTQIIGTVEVLR